MLRCQTYPKNIFWLSRRIGKENLKSASAYSLTDDDFFPTLKCWVFVSVLYPLLRLLPPSPSLTLTHSLITHSLTHSIIHSLTHSLISLTHSLISLTLHCQRVGCTPWRPLVLFGLRSFCVAGVAQSPLPRGRMYALASPGAVWSPQLLRGRRGTISTAKGSDVRPAVPWCCLVSAAFAWQA